MRVTYQAEPLTTAWPELRHLLVDHWLEASSLPEIDLAPDIEAYAEMEDRGAVRFYTARAEGKIVGYATFLIQEHQHAKGVRVAHQDFIFVAKEWRRWMLPVRLLRTAEMALQAEGVRVVYHHAKSARFGGVLEKMGYEIVAVQYAKTLR